mmetsp:Transcript_73761/g.208226  ORF Transcript_73761/g.208226 Transcript_73761/m.208226 type:complete len:328 (-) Transcript_73761:70-1053(-)
MPAVMAPGYTVSSFCWRGLSRDDLVQLAPGEPGNSTLRQGEVGQVVQDLRHGPCPFQVQGPRGDRGWYRGESLVPHVPPERQDRSRTQEPLIRQIVAALDPTSHLDFPTITEICDSAAQNPAGADVAIAVLVSTLGEQVAKDGDTRNITQDYYKVLTIFNEMLYDGELVEVLRCTPGLLPALDRLCNFRESDWGGSVDENIRLLSNEVRKKVFEDGRRSKKPSARMEIIEFCPKGHLLTWKERQSLFHLHSRECALCHRSLANETERYGCPRCKYYNVCISCIRWGRPQQPPEARGVGRDSSLGAADEVRHNPKDVPLQRLSAFVDE